MADAVSTPQAALNYEAGVNDDGRVEVQVLFSPGVHVTVFVIEQPGEQFDELAAAAQSSLDFWDNPIDDERWSQA
jgi:hypothetical protein